MKILNWFKEHIAETIIATVMLVCIIVIGVVFAALVKNESNRISEGTVIDKEYTRAYVETVYTKINDNRIPHCIYHPESYSMQIKGVKDGETVTYWFECTAEEYQKYNIGDYYRK